MSVFCPKKNLDTSHNLKKKSSEFSKSFANGTMEPLPRSWLAFARSCMVMVSLPRSWQDLGKASKEQAMELGKGIMASNTG